MNRGGPWEQQRGRDRRSNPRPRQRFNTPRLMDFGGPAETARNLSTDHLQLQELDLELALLKKKRQLIEKQQAVANQIQPLFASSSQYDYVEPRERFDSRTFGQSGGLMREYSELYGDGSGAGKKRGAPEAWQGGAPRPRKPRLQPQSARPNLPPPSAPKFAPKDKFFKPNKVTKPTYTPPNKRQGDVVNERPFANWEATKNSDDTPEVYDAHKPMSAKVLGRLELALGHVLKVIRFRFENGKHAEVFKCFHSLRELKQTIRNRIREVMQGMVVGRWDSIITLYRAKYPEDSDGQLLENIRKTNSKLKAKATIESIESANFVPYLKKSFYSLMGQTLDNMFLKIKEVYEKDTFGFQTVGEIYDTSLLEIAKECNEAAEEKDKDSETTSEAVDDGSNILDKVNETPDSENTTSMEKSDTQNENNESSMEKDDSVNEKPEIEDGKNDISNLEDATKVEVISESADLSNNVKEDKFRIQRRKTDFNDDDAKARWANRFVVKLLRRQLPNELPKFKNHIIQIIKNDPEFIAMRTLLGEENEKKDETPKKVKNATPFNKKIYYVMIVGRPRLPPKTEMKEFLNSFNPVSIKKHKATSNILFVGFDNKDNFDNIIANSDIRIANMKLKIKESEKMIKTSSIEDTSKESESQQNASNVSEKNSSELIDEHLDNQINDLLTTIRQEEEKKSGEVASINEEKNDIDEQAEPKTFDAAPDGSAEDAGLEGKESVTASTENTEDAGDEGKESVTAENDWDEEANKLHDEVTVINDDEKVDDDVVISDDKSADDEVTIVNDEKKDTINKDLEEVKNEIIQAKSTPARASTRLAATPRTVRTRRSSRLGQD